MNKRIIITFYALLGCFHSVKAQLNEIDLTKNVYKLITEIPKNELKFGTHDLNFIFSNNAEEFFKDIIDAKCKSKLQKDIFLKSEEFKLLKDSLNFLKKEINTKVYFTNIKSKVSYESFSFYYDIEKYDIDKKLKSVIINYMDAWALNQDKNPESTFGDFYIPAISYNHTNRILDDKPKREMIKLVQIPLSLDEAIKFDQKEIEVYMAYTFNGLKNSKAYSKKIKLYFSINDTIIFERLFTEEPEQKKNIPTANKALPFIGTKQITDDAYATDYLITIKKDKTCLIKMGTGRGSSEEIIYKGVFKNLIKTDDGIIKISNSFIELLDSKGNLRQDCTKTVKNEYINCGCRFNIITLNLE